MDGRRWRRVYGSASLLDLPNASPTRLFQDIWGRLSFGIRRCLIWLFLLVSAWLRFSFRGSLGGCAPRRLPSSCAVFCWHLIALPSSCRLTTNFCRSALG